MTPISHAISMAAVALASPAAAASGTAPSQLTQIADSLTIPCDGLSSSAVRIVPAPLDQYATLVCTNSGQSLRPIKATWYFFSLDSGSPKQLGALWPSAGNSNGPSKDDYYSELSYKPLSSDELTSMRAELARIQTAPEILARNIFRFAVTTSWGAHKELYLLPPTAGAGPDEQTVGMECIHACRPIDKDPWFFTIVPDK